MESCHLSGNGSLTEHLHCLPHCLLLRGAQGSYFLLGVSAKHFREDVSTTVSQNVTTGSATWNNNRFVAGSVLFRLTQKPLCNRGHRALIATTSARWGGTKGRQSPCTLCKVCFPILLSLKDKALPQLGAPPPSAPHLDINLRIHLPQIMHHTIQVELPCSQDHVFSRLFHLKNKRRVQLPALLFTGPCLAEPYINIRIYQH